MTVEMLSEVTVEMLAEIADDHGITAAQCLRHPSILRSYKIDPASISVTLCRRADAYNRQRVDMALRQYEMRPLFHRVVRNGRVFDEDTNAVLAALGADGWLPKEVRKLFDALGIALPHIRPIEYFLQRGIGNKAKHKKCRASLTPRQFELLDEVLRTVS